MDPTIKALVLSAVVLDINKTGPPAVFLNGPPRVAPLSPGGILMPVGRCSLHQLSKYANTRSYCAAMQNDLEFLRIRSFKHEIMVAASE